MSAPAAPLAPDLDAGLRRLKLAAVRRLGPEVLQAAKTQRWAPEELLRTLVEAEITARDESNARNRLRTAAFPVTKALDEWGRFLPEHTTAVSLLDRLIHHSVVVVTDGESYRMREARQRGGDRTPKKR